MITKLFLDPQLPSNVGSRLRVVQGLGFEMASSCLGFRGSRLQVV